MAEEKKKLPVPEYYNGVRLAPNTQCAYALADGNFELAAKLHKESMDEFWKHNKGWKPFPPPRVSTVSNEKEYKQAEERLKYLHKYIHRNAVDAESAPEIVELNDLMNKWEWAESA